MRIVSRTAVSLIVMVSLTACQMLPEQWPGSQWFNGRSRPPAKPGPIAASRFALAPGDDVIGQVQVVIARHEDTLPDLARRFNLGYEEIVAANPGVDPWLPGAGTRIVLPTQFVLPDAPREGIVLNLATLRLFYFLPAGADQPQTVITHPVGIGRVGWATPTGTTRIVSKAANPTWHVPESIRREHAERGDPLPATVPPGPDNPLGSHALRLALPGYLLHGTNKPYGVGMRVSHGCIRLYPEDVAALYQQVPVDTPVHIVNQPMLAGWRGGMLYLEAHPPLEDDRSDWQDRLSGLLIGEATRAAADGQAIDWERAARLAGEPHGLPLPVLAGAPDRQAVLAQARVVDNVAPPAADYPPAAPNLL
ncbi:MAG: L,D-transpeptidase family protein [Pseudomonadota bacterium]|nr:L,D-transpeptidase family protein [Pseudomonadota bacterium]